MLKGKELVSAYSPLDKIKRSTQLAIRFVRRCSKFPAQAVCYHCGVLLLFSEVEVTLVRILAIGRRTEGMVALMRRSR
jgi:hypothetical protein